MLLDPSMRIPLESLPVFPLPNSVLFPGQSLPLHIFEPRYRQMVRDALESSPYFVLAKLEAAAKEDPPPFASIATVGKIVAHHRLSDGRFNILLEGIVRASLEELPSEKLYRKVRCTALAEPEDPGAARERMALVSLANLVVSSARSRSNSIEMKLPSELPLPTLALRIADRLVHDPSARQAILEAETTSDRVAATMDALAQVLSTMGPTPSRTSN